MEAVARIQFRQRGDVARLELELLRRLLQRHVLLDRHQGAVERQPLQHCAQVLADLAADPIGIGDHRIQRAVLAQPLGGGLGPALVHAADVVHGVAHQRQEIHDLLRTHAELGHHPGLVEHAARHRVGQGDARPHQLGEVLVAGGDVHRDAGRMRLHGERADDVVGLHPWHAQDREAQRLDDLLHRFDLGAQVVGHGAAGGLVLGIQRIAEGRPRRVQDEGDVVGVLLQRRPQHVDDAEQRAGRTAIRGGQRRQGVEGTEQVGRSVDQDQAGHGQARRGKAAIVGRPSLRPGRAGAMLAAWTAASPVLP